MSAFTFRPAVASNLGLFIGLAGGTSSGKTWSAMELASGIVGSDKPFAVVDTEARRASHYARHFRFDVFDLEAPYSSDRYKGAVEAAFKAGYGAIVVDSATHEHDNVGGYLDAQAHDLEERVERAMKKNPNAREWDLVEKLTPSSWIKPKRARTQMMQALLACSSTVPIIFCFRAEEKVFATKDGKLVAQNPPVWTPICGKNMPFEMTVFFMMYREQPGIPHPIKKLSPDHAPLFNLKEQLGREAGRRIAEWARGGAPSTASPPGMGNAPIPSDAAGGDATITPNQAADLHAFCVEHDIPTARLKKAAGLGEGDSLERMPLAKFDGAMAFLKGIVAKRVEGQSA